MCECTEVYDLLPWRIAVAHSTEYGAYSGPLQSQILIIQHFSYSDNILEYGCLAIVYEESLDNPTNSFCSGTRCLLPTESDCMGLLYNAASINCKLHMSFQHTREMIQLKASSKMSQFEVILSILKDKNKKVLTVHSSNDRICFLYTFQASVVMTSERHKQNSLQAP